MHLTLIKQGFFVRYFAAAAAFWLLGFEAKADAQNCVLNFSFESPAGGVGTVAGEPWGWEASNLNPYGVLHPAPGLYTNVVWDMLPYPADGSQVLWIDGENYVAQFLTNTLAGGQTYTLSGAIGNRSDGYGIQLPGDEEYVYLLAGETVIASNLDLPHPAPGSFLPWSISYTSPASNYPTGPLEIRLGQIGAGQVHFDNVVLSQGAGSVVGLVASPNPALAGSLVVLTATVSGAGGVPTGSVNFFDNGFSLGSVPLDGTGQASWSATGLSATGSPHAILAVYGGDATFAPGVSSVLSQVITNLADPTLTSLAVGSNRAISGVNFSFESPAGGVGTVAGEPGGWEASNLNPYGVLHPAPGLYTNVVGDMLPYPADGSQVLWIDGENYVAQFLTNTLAGGQTYTLSGAIGNRSDGYGIQLPGDEEYVYLLAGGTVIASNLDLPHPAPGSFLPWSISYTSQASNYPTGTLEIRLGQLGAGQVHFDNLALNFGPASPPTNSGPQNCVLNFSFESPAGGVGTVAGEPWGWEASNLNPYGVLHPAPGLYTNVVGDMLPYPADGSQVLWIDGENYVAQFLTNTLAGGQTYTLSGAIGNRSDGYGIQLPGDEEYVYLLAGGTVIASNLDLPHPAPGSFLPWSISYTSPASNYPTGTLEIRLGQIGAGQVHFDNVVLSQGAGSVVGLAASPNPALAGSLVVLTATVSGAGGVPTGSVNFFDNGFSLGSVPLDGTGQASWSATGLSATGSPHAILAVYGGDATFAPGVSSVLSQVITNLADPTLNSLAVGSNRAISGVNFSFESPAGGVGTVAGEPGGWEASNLNPYGVLHPAPGLYTNVVGDMLPYPADGSQVLWIDGENYVAQFLTNTLAGGQTYTLSGAIGNRSDGYGIQLPGDEEYVYLLAGGTVIASNLDLPHPAPGSFLPWSISYTSQASNYPTGTLEIRLGQLGAGQVHFDNLALNFGPASPPTNSGPQNCVLNFSFESPAGGVGTVAGEPWGWEASNLNPYGVLHPAPGLYTNVVGDMLPYPADGSQVLWIDGENYVAQFLTNTLAGGQTYTLSGAIGNRSDGYGIQLPGDEEYVYLLAGGTVIASNLDLPHPAPGSFLPWSISYTSPASNYPTGPLEIRLGQIGAGQVHFDNVVLSQGAGNEGITRASLANVPAANSIFAIANGITLLPDKTVQINFTGIPGRNYLIQAATNLAPVSSWSTLSTNTADTNGFFNYIDADATNNNARFYKAVLP